MQYLFLFIFLLITACSKNEEQVDNWETPSLTFKKAEQDSSQKSVVTQSFRSTLAPNDQFEFAFKGENTKKQKSIVNVRVRAKCADDADLTKGVFEETYDLGTRPIFTAHDLLPPLSILENSKSVFCKWTIIAINNHGSTRSYSMPVLRLDDDNSSSKISIKDADGKVVPPGSSITFQNSRGMTFSPPDSGSYTSTLSCDLLSIGLSPSNPTVGDFVVEQSNNEELRYKNPTQRCLIEVKSNTGKIYRSPGFKFYLFPSELSTTQITYTPNNGPKVFDGSEVMGTVRIINNSDQERTYGFYASTIPYDVFFFDDHGDGGPEGYLPNSTYYWYQRKHDGRGKIQSEAGQYTDVAGRKMIVLKPHQDFKDIVLRFDYVINCTTGGGEWSFGGIRVEVGTEIFGERAPYLDKKGNLVDLTIPGTKINWHAPVPYYIQLHHNKLVGHPATHNREWRLINKGC